LGSRISLAENFEVHLSYCATEEKSLCGCEGAIISSGSLTAGPRRRRAPT